MEYNGVRDIAIYGTDCIATISRGDDDTLRFVSAREKYFDLALDDGTLTVRQKSRNFFYMIIYHRIEFKIILPKSFAGKLRFRNKNGGLYIAGADFTEVELSTKNGKFDIRDMSCVEFTLKMQNGSLSAKNFTATNSANVKCSNGNIRVESARAPLFTISCANAGLTAIDVKAKRFECTTSNGTIDAGGITADDLKLETSNGKITASPLGSRDDYKLSAETTHGSLLVDGVAYKKLADVVHATKKLNVKTANGDIDIRFL